MENREEIDLVQVVAKLWYRRKTIFWFILFFLIVGTGFIFMMPRKYTAKCTLGLEVEDKTTRITIEGMSTFQNMNRGDVHNSKIVSPSMYPNVLFSVPFQKELIYFPLYVNEQGDTITFYKYFIAPGNQGTVTVGGKTSIERLNAEEMKCLKYLKKAIHIKVNSQEENLKIEVEMPDRRLAAELAYQAQIMLQAHITKFRVAKAQAALDFIDERYREIKQELDQKQQALIDFREKNKNQLSVQTKTKEEILTNEYKLFFELYSDIVKQREKAKIQVKENVPMLTVIEPVVEPTLPSSPRPVLILLVSFFAGLFVGCGWILLAPILKQIKEH